MAAPRRPTLAAIVRTRLRLYPCDRRLLEPLLRLLPTQARRVSRPSRNSLLPRTLETLAIQPLLRCGEAAKARHRRTQIDGFPVGGEARGLKLVDTAEEII